MGAAAARDAPRRIGAAARAERHRRRPRRAPRVHRSGVWVRAGRRRVRVRGVRREEPPSGDAPRARPLLRRPRRSRRRSRRLRVLVRCLLRGVLRGVAARQPHVHTLSRRHAGDGEDAVEAVGAGGRAFHAEPPLNSGTASPFAAASLHWVERNHSRCRRKVSRPPRTEKDEEKKKKRISVTRVWWAAAFHLGLSYLGPLANQRSFSMMMIPFMPKDKKNHA